MPHHHHAIDYIELPAPELDAARSFYAAAFGWEFKDYGPEYAAIRGPEPDSPEAGGLAAQGRDKPLIILYSSDLDASVRSVRDAGGTVVDGPYDFPGGRRFHFTDPAGNELAVWSQASEESPQGSHSS